MKSKFFNEFLQEFDEIKKFASQSIENIQTIEGRDQVIRASRFTKLHTNLIN